MLSILALALVPYTATAEPPAPVTFPVAGSASPLAVAYAAPRRGRHKQVGANFHLEFNGWCEGAGVAFLATAAYGAKGPAPHVARWEEPNLQRSLSVGFDTYDPPTQDAYNADGNIYNRPQHQVSLHWDGIEIANVVSPVAFEDGLEHNVAVSFQFVTGGCLASVSIDGAYAYKDYFVIGPVPYRCRLAFGFDQGTPPLPTITTAAGTIPDPNATPIPPGTCDFSLLSLTFGKHARPMPSPTRVDVFQGVDLNAANQNDTATVDLPDASKPVARIILTLTLSAPPGGIDPWDRAGSIYVYDDIGQRYEILRFITPFGRGYTWHADVTDYQSLLHGRRNMEVAIDTWVKGWSVDVTLDYYFGQTEMTAFRVTNLWSGNWEYGNPADPIDAHFVPVHPIVDFTTKDAIIRCVITGHGQSPNTDNAAEFMPSDRTLTVNGQPFENLLWTTDNWLNPCRPQGGTWKYDRAGWGPGALVVPWDVDVTDIVQPGVPATVEYRPQSYINANAGKSRASFIVEVQLIEFH